MERYHLRAALCLTALTALMVGTSAGELVSDPEVSSVKLSPEVQPDGRVSGSVTNLTNDELKDVRIMIRHTWHWNNEFKPGENDPGRASYVTLPQTIPPGGSVDFQYIPQPALPARSDGHFETTAEVVGVARIAYPDR